MRPVSGTGGGPYFGDTMGEDRWGGRVYSTEEGDSYEKRVRNERERLAPWGQTRPAHEENVGPYDWRREREFLKKERPGKPKGSQEPPPPLNCPNRFFRCITHVVKKFPNNPARIQRESALCSQTYDNCQAACKDRRKYLVVSEWWPLD